MLRSGGAARAAVVVDDFAPFRRLVARLLSREGWRVHEAGGGRAALRLIARHRPSVVVLDWCLERGQSGLAVLRALRRCRSLAATPVILVSAQKDAAEDEAAALAAGASLFLSKAELVASGSAFVRHVQALSQADRQTLPLDEGFHLDPASGVLAGPGTATWLNPQEVRLLELLCRARGRLVSHETLWAEVWEKPCGGWRHLLTNRVSTLRGKLGPLARRLVCRKGEGFLLERASSAL